MCRTPLAGLFVFALALGVCQPIAAQTADRAFANLGRSIHSGDTIIVTSRETGEMRGKLVRLSPTSLVVAVKGGQEREILSTDVGRIERIGDPTWTGAVFGAIPAGLLFSSAAGASCSPNCSRDTRNAAIIGAALGALIGAGIDGLHQGRTMVYRASPTPAPSARAEAPVVPQPARPSTSAAQQVPASSLDSLWSRVNPGDPISIRQTNGESAVGKFARASESSVTVDDGDRSLVIPAADVQQVTLMRGGNKTKKGLLIGGTIGAFLGFTSCGSQSGCGPALPVMTGVGLLVGDMIGASRPGSRPIVVYPTTAPTVRVMPVFTPSMASVMASVQF